MADEKNQSGDSDDAGAEAIPEVEAEIVDESAADDGRLEFEESGLADEDQAAPPPEKPSSKKLFSPGVILLAAFVAVALAAIFFWRLQSGRESGSPTPVVADDPAPLAEQAVEPSSPPSGVEPVDRALPEISGEEAAPETRNPVPENEGPDGIPTPAEASKILNDAGSISKDDLEIGDVSPGASEEDNQNTDETFLPPLPSTDAEVGNLELQRAAKEAAREFGPAGAAPSSVDPGSQEGIIEFDLGGEEATEPAAPGGAAEEVIIPGEAIDVDELAAVNGVPTSPPVNNDASVKIANDVDDIKQRLVSQERQFAEILEEERARSGALAEELAALRREFEQALNARDQDANQKIENLRADLDKIRNVDAPSGRAAAGAMALAGLQRRLDAGEPYNVEFDILRRIIPDHPALDPLQSHAEIGAPTAAVLNDAFPAAARAGLTAAGLSQATGFWGKLRARAQSIISIRPATPTEGDAARAVLSRAEAAASANDFAAALAEIETLPVEAQEAMSEWTKKAKSRADVSAAVVALERAFPMTGLEQAE